MDMLMVKRAHGLVPATEEGAEWLARKKPGAMIMVDAREPRNGGFHRKWFALVQLGYDYWADNAETIEYKGQRVLPDFDRFRHDVTILAGFYRPVANIKGEVRIEAESLKWAQMTEERFEKLYDATIRVLLEKVFNGRVFAKWTREELERVAQQVMDFAA